MLTKKKTGRTFLKMPKGELKFSVTMKVKFSRIKAEAAVISNILNNRICFCIDQKVKKTGNSPSDKPLQNVKDDHDDEDIVRKLVKELNQD